MVLSCFLNALQSKSNHFSSFGVFFLSELFAILFQFTCICCFLKYVIDLKLTKLTPSLVVSNVLFINIVNRFFSSAEFRAWINLSALSEVHLYLCWT